MALKGYFVTQRRMLRLGGLSLDANENFFYRSYCFVLRVCFVIYFVALVSDLVIDSDDLDVVINSLYHAIAIAIVLSKTWVVVFNAAKLDQTLSMLEKGIFAPNPQRGGAVEETWINECVTNSRRLTTIGSVLTVTACSIPIVASMIRRITTEDSKDWELPFGKFAAVNPNSYFDFAWLFQSIMFNVAGVIFISTDFLVALVFAHICVQFKMLRNSILKNITPKCQEMLDDGRTSSEEDYRYLVSKLKENVLYHMAIIDLASQFEKILSNLMLNTYLAEMFALGCIMYHGSLYSPWDPRFQKDAMMIAAVSFEVFLVSYWGNEVMLQSQMVQDACYAVDISGLDVRLQKSLCLIMARSLTPVKFTAGKFVNLSLITFVAVMRASFSYYMVLRSVNGER